MYILRTLGCLAIILAFSYANICGTVGGIFEEFDILSDDTAKEIDEGCSVVAEKIVKTGKAIKTFYDNHKKLILAGELILLAGTGLGEAGLGNRNFALPCYHKYYSQGFYTLCVKSFNVYKNVSAQKAKVTHFPFSSKFFQMS